MACTRKWSLDDLTHKYPGTEDQDWIDANSDPPPPMKFPHYPPINKPGGGTVDKCPPSLLNTDSAADLARKLPGIGPVMAGRIVQHREEHGPFEATEHLTRVKGIGQKTYQRLKPHVKL